MLFQEQGQVVLAGGGGQDKVRVGGVASRSWACSVPAHLLPHTDGSPEEEFLGRAFHRQRGNGDEGVMEERGVV